MKKLMFIIALVLFGCQKDNTTKPSTNTTPPSKSTYRQDTLTTLVIKVYGNAWKWDSVAKDFYFSTYISPNYVSYSGKPNDDFNFDVLNNGWQTVNTTTPGNPNDTLEFETTGWNMSLGPPQLGVRILYWSKVFNKNFPSNDTIVLKEVIYGK